MTLRSQLRELVALGPLLVLAFFAEGLLAKGSFSGIHIGFDLHMVLTALCLAMLAAAGEILPLRCPQRAWQDTCRRTRGIRDFAGCLAAWGLVSCLFQESFFEANLIFWAMWVTTYLVAFRSVPRLLSGLRWETRVTLLSVMLMTGIIGSLFVPEYKADRFVGVFGAATWTGLFMAAAVAHWTAHAFLAKRIIGPWLFLLGAALVMLLATRTRASIAAAALGAAACLANVCLRQKAPGRKRAWGILALSGCGFMILAILFASAERSEKRRVAEHLRVEEGMERVYLTARARNWEQGASNFFENGLVGRGFLSKFGNQSGTQRVLGIDLPRYDWPSAEDPLNSVFLINQQIGLPGAMLFLLLLSALSVAGLRTQECLRVYLAGFLAVGLVVAFLSGNWLLSFGDSFDRYSYIALAALVYCPEVQQKSRRCPITTSRSHGRRA